MPENDFRQKSLTASGLKLGSFGTSSSSSLFNNRLSPAAQPCEKLTAFSSEPVPSGKSRYATPSNLSGIIKFWSAAVISCAIFSSRITPPFFTETSEATRINLHAYLRMAPSMSFHQFSPPKSFVTSHQVWYPRLLNWRVNQRQNSLSSGEAWLMKMMFRCSAMFNVYH